jgi:hypothetical protein
LNLRESDLLQTLDKDGTIGGEHSRRLLACGLDELQRDAMHLERALLHALNQVREMQGKRPVIVPRG